MKKINLTVIALIAIVFTQFAQRDLTPGGRKKSSYFGGAADFKEYRPFGLQLSVGPTFTLATRKTPISVAYPSVGRSYTLTTTPKGMPGIFAEIGMIHYPTKRSKLSKRLNYIFISYIDWGLGFKMYNGMETTQIDLIDSVNGQTISSSKQSGNFSNLFASARISVHKNIYFGEKYFIDNGLGIVADYNFKRYPPGTYTVFVNQSVPNRHYFHQQFLLHFDYNLGFGIKLSRRSLLIPSVQLPIFGLIEWRKGASDFKWFDSNYYPMIVKLKWAYLFEKKTKGCAPAKVNGQDKDTMNKY